MTEPMSDERLEEIRSWQTKPLPGNVQVVKPGAVPELLAEIDRLRAENEALQSNEKVTRVTVVQHDRGRDYEQWDFEGVEMHLQDDGRTLKIIDKGRSSGR